MRLSAGFLLLLFAFQNHFVRAQSAASPAAQYFFNKASFPTGKSPEGIAIADMNGDGRPDLIVANANGPSVSILLGQSDGTFGAKTDFSLQESPGVLVASDFNSDGKIDIAVTGRSGVTVVPGNGDGTLGTPVTYPSANAPFLLAVSDFNHDGKQDLATLRPEGIEWPFAPDGKPSNHLEFLSAVNKLEHANAHDALSDVNATIDLAKFDKSQTAQTFRLFAETAR